MTPHMRRGRLLGALAFTLLAGTASAEDLTIALSSEPTAVDPHYHDLSSNNALTMHVFDALLTTDAQQKVQPNLATRWTNEGPTTWRFELRDDVVFSDGTPFTAEDVIFSYCRVLNNETAVSGSFDEAIKNMASIETPDDHTLVFETNEPDPLLPIRLAQIAIISDEIVEHGEISFDPESACGVTGAWPTVNDFNDGSVAVGTGPYAIESYVKGSGIDLVRNERYFGETPEWERVSFKPVPNAGPRLAGLLSGDYDVIENPAARDLSRIEGSDDYEYVITPSSRVIYLQLDMRDDSPFVDAPDGSNPFQDVRVRRAMSMAIDREAIVERIMDDAAAPANQFLPAGMFGTIADAPALEYDPERARELLAEAGYPDGFSVTFHATNDRYINDAQVAQAVAQFFTRIGIETELDAMTRSIFFSRRSGREFSLSMGGWGSDTGEASSFLRQWVPTTDDVAGLGGSNYGGWSDPEFDVVLREAIATMDDAEREALLQQAGARVLEQMPYIPLHYESTIWAFRSGLDYQGRADQYTLATAITSDE
ncbi:ABC transporter substrate-binding protein [Salinarimonas ramus]|uniref:Transporter n=1 Tax=Salinarimonas ramus TaxID=690164 RepID=A0A917Q4I7_9HYPH|nr:ABC transporter substrate-binding protein [Salinarimonas ramus]GGK20642.1 transporter [Salinarimonas ramus]